VRFGRCSSTYRRPIVEPGATSKADVSAIRREMLDELLDALGVEKVARPESPAVVWQEALAKVRAAARRR